MKNRIAELVVACAAQIRKPLHDLPRLARHQPRNHLVMQPLEDRRIARKIAAIEQRNRKLDVIGIEAFAFRKRPRGGTELETQVPKLLRKRADPRLEFLLGLLCRVEEKYVD